MLANPESTRYVQPTDSETPVLDVRGLTAGYGGARVIRNATMAVAPGEVVAVIGKNGMGKSTLLKAIVNVVKPWSGVVHLKGQQMTGLKTYRVARAGITFVPQEKAIFGELTVEENVRLALPRRAEIDSAMASVEALFPKLSGRRNQKAGTLSGGEQKMLLLARALVTRPRLLIIDEITEGLQPSVRVVLREALEKERASNGTSIVLVEQDLDFAFQIADRYAVMKLGDLGEFASTAKADWRAVAEAHLAV
ncbi:ABC transporter ATP-binding protein [Mycolicibacterium mageritense]|uniref:ABC transporter ATP-binding protein n=1 Tax=Mycolicibacterium mageritense TaxID=53462 RepID=UPI0011D80853|nr:ABC transporter ATP-binding protein [Mycolicibacterium mageritense]TXI54062.1 MAG: ABC transporter ATP-binding protein [Mycolicibacterium mageritense]